MGGHLLLRVLGSGGMGSVYLARHPNLPRDVALKVLHPALAQTEEQRARFAREAELLCRLSHPNIVDVLDRGQDGDRLWMSMPYVDGHDLAAQLRTRGPAPPGEALRIVVAVGAALDHAHSRGLLHRDVKPANILLAPQPDGSERVFLTDFGIARAIEGSQQLTRQGQFTASLAYAAPEQLAGGRLDARTDVYGLGAVLFELLTGRRVFDNEEPLALLWAVVHQPAPDIRALRPDLPPQLSAVLARALAKDPEQRYRSCGELVAAARAALQPAPAPLPPSPPLPLPTASAPTRPWVWVAVASGAAALVAAAVALVVVLAAPGGGGGSDGGGTAGRSSGPVSPASPEAVPAEQAAALVERDVEAQLGLGVEVTCEDDLPSESGAEIRCVLQQDGTAERYGVTLTYAGPGYVPYWRVDEQPLAD